MHAGGLRFDRRDVLLAAASFLATVVYLSRCPPVLMPGDEANYLQEAKRVAQGEVLYRDIFELTTPAWMFLVAGLFRLCGTGIVTAKAAIWTVNGLTAAIVFLVRRVLDVRRPLAWVISLVPLAVSFPGWPFASQHWLATMLSVLLLLACLVTNGKPASARLLPGIVLGLLIATHQRGAVVGAGVAAWMVVDRLLATGDRWWLASVAWFVSGALLVVVPLAICLVTSAGVIPVWQALVVHPLVHYRAFITCPWGSPNAITSLFSFPTVIKYAPFVLVVPVLRLVGRAGRGETRSRGTADTGEASTDARSPLLLCIMTGAAAILSILYYPDSTHIGFIAPLLLVVLAETLEWAFRRLPSRPVVTVLGAAAIAMLAGGTAIHLRRNLLAWRALFPLREDTAFGRIAVDLWTARDDDYVRILLRIAPDRSIFGYPDSAARYCLIADARNPTRFEHFVRGYNTPEQLEEVKTVLAKRPPAYVVLNAAMGPWDPIRPILARNYTELQPGNSTGSLKIWIRRSRASVPFPGGGRPGA